MALVVLDRPARPALRETMRLIICLTVLMVVELEAAVNPAETENKEHVAVEAEMVER
ncbi:hypothetical protein [Bradyrhizobium genosp. A]|uniref:hypothetical protein n=1 Tax=Bradyrhizobium genosp. A TaxID=83626 RepID=UPI003CFAC874